MRKKLYQALFFLTLILAVPVLSDLDGFIRVALAATAGANNCAIGVNDTSTGSVAWVTPGNACVASASTSTGNITSTTPSNYLKVTNFGFSIPTGSVIQGIVFTVSRSSTVNKGNRAIDNAVRVVKGGTIGSTDNSNGSNWATTPVNYGTTAYLWGDSWTAADVNSTGFGLAISAKSNGANAIVGTISAFITATITYQAPPNAPSQDAPADTATDVSLTPTFTMTATDPESDALNYEVEIYSNSGCTTVVQTNDQSVSQTGWSGTNTTCGSPSRNCYTSGTQGTYLTQSALSGSTQYWWKAFAKDPSGSNYYVASSTCKSFTTLVPVSVILNTSGIISYSILNTNTTKSTSDISQTQTVRNDSPVTENLNIKTTDAVGGTQWSLGSSPGSNIFVFEFMAAGDPGYTKFITTGAYQTLVTGITSSSTKDVDLRITTPTSTTDYQQKTITVTVQAVAP